MQDLAECIIKNLSEFHDISMKRSVLSEESGVAPG